MTRQIIRRSFADDPRFELVGEYTEHVSVEVAVDRSKADFVIVGSDVFEAQSLGRRVLQEGPQVRVLAVRPDGSRTTLHRLEPVTIDYDNLSTDHLVELMTGKEPVT